MFVVIYRWRLKPGREDDFVAAWSRTTEVIREKCGSGGSALAGKADGTWAAIARWPDREAWKNCHATDDALITMRECIEQSFPYEELDVVADLWCGLSS